MTELSKLVIATLITFFITLCLNKFFSLFRYRQLYATIYDDISDAYSGGRQGRSLTVILGNKGKDKEEDIELHFLTADDIKLISSNSVGVKASGNSIKIDRIIKNEKIKLCIFIEGTSDKLSKKNVLLRSTDANGFLYFSQGREPVGLGPVISSISFLVVIIGWMVYGINTGAGPDYGYNYIRYWNFYQSGFHIDSLSNNRLLSGMLPTSTEHPIKFISGYKQDHIIIFVFEITNTTDVKIKASAEANIIDKEYSQRQNTAIRAFSKEDSDRYWTALFEDFGHTNFEVKENEAFILPHEKATIMAIREHGKLSKGIDFVVKIDINFEDSVRYSDNDEYIFNPKSAGINESTLNQL